MYVSPAVNVCHALFYCSFYLFIKLCGAIVSSHLEIVYLCSVMILSCCGKSFVPYTYVYYLFRCHTNISILVCCTAYIGNLSHSHLARKCLSFVNTYIWILIGFSPLVVCVLNILVFFSKSFVWSAMYYLMYLISWRIINCIMRFNLSAPSGTRFYAVVLFWGRPIGFMFVSQDWLTDISVYAILFQWVISCHTMMHYLQT